MVSCEDEFDFEADVMSDLVEAYADETEVEGSYEERRKGRRAGRTGAYCPECLYSRPPQGLEPGKLTNPDRCWGRWFVPKYRVHPSNLWDLAREIEARMSTTPGIAKYPSQSEIRARITSHPCNAHFSVRAPMFMPRFKSDRFTRGGNYYGAIYIPWKFRLMQDF